MRQQGPCVENVLDQAGFTEEEKLLGGKAPPTTITEEWGMRILEGLLSFQVYSLIPISIKSRLWGYWMAWKSRQSFPHHGLFYFKKDFLSFL